MIKNIIHIVFVIEDVPEDGEERFCQISLSSED